MTSDIYKSKSVNALLEVISKGIDLLSRDEITKDILDSWIKYVVSTLELVDAVYNTNYAIELSDRNNYYNNILDTGWDFTPQNTIYRGTNYFGNTIGLNPFGSNSKTNINNKNKYVLEEKLQKLINIIKKLTREL